MLTFLIVDDSVDATGVSNICSCVGKDIEVFTNVVLLQRSLATDEWCEYKSSLTAMLPCAIPTNSLRLASCIHNALAAKGMG